MPHLHLFFPENDLALAADTARYTAPPIVVKLRRAGATLPLWYGKPGDFVMTEGINAQWFDRIKSTFRLSIDPFSQYSSDMTPAPWGWSIASRRFFEINGVPASVLPIDQSLSEIRQLSHRRTAARIATLIQETIPTALAPVAHECSSVNEVRDIVTRLGRAVIKLPWSSSGRGVIPVEAKDFDKQEKSVEGMIRRQGSVMVEPFYDKKLDFAALFELYDGHCCFSGFSVFETAGFSSYSGNILAPDEYLHDMICSALGDNRQLDAVISAMPPLIEELIGKNYNGALGIDMMAVNADDYSLVPAVELNLRMTMGHVCHRFYSHFVANGRTGRFSISKATNAGLIDCDVRDARIYGGTLDLAQPGADFSFLVDIH